MIIANFQISKYSLSFRNKFVIEYSKAEHFRDSRVS